MQAGDATRAWWQHWGSSTGSALLSSMEKRSVDLQHSVGRSCASHEKGRKGAGNLKSTPIPAGTLPLLPCAPHSSLRSSSAAWEAVKVSSKVVVSL